MKLTTLLTGAFIALTSTVAQAADNYIGQLNDTSEGSIMGTLFKNGVVNDTITFPGETIDTNFRLRAEATVVTSFDDRFNFYEPGTLILSDTSEISGTNGSTTLNLHIVSDDGSPLTPLPNGGVHFETGVFQDIVATPIVASNGDTYSFQMASDLNGVPEPATWALMLLGLGGLGAVMRTTPRKNGAALAQA